jgi:ferrous iron transport protein B
VLVGPYGLLTLGLFNALATVLPILTVFYIPFGVLEDIGYFPRLSVQFDRLFRYLGLNGNAVLPITLGFGCSAVATVAVRRLETKKERFIAAFLIALGVPCSGQLGGVIAILATLPVAALAGTVLIVFGIQVVAGMTLTRFFPQKNNGEFLLELPPLRAPQWSNILLRTYYRIAEFFTEAVPLFVASAATLLSLHYTGLLDRIRSLLAPVVVTGLGLPRNYADALLILLARRELGAVMLKKMADDHALTLQQTFVGLLVMILFLPCMTTTMAMARVLGWKSAVVISVSVIAIATATGSIVHLLWA